MQVVTVDAVAEESFIMCDGNLLAKAIFSRRFFNCGTKFLCSYGLYLFISRIYYSREGKRFADSLIKVKKNIFI